MHKWFKNSLHEKHRFMKKKIKAKGILYDTFHSKEMKVFNTFEQKYEWGAQVNQLIVCEGGLYETSFFRRKWWLYDTFLSKK